MLTDARLPDASALELNPPGRLLVIGFYSVGTPYEDEARILAASLDRVGIKYSLTGFKDRGSWDKNTAVKAEMIRAARLALSVPLLYVDVDAIVHVDVRPYLQTLAADVDFGAHFFAGPAFGHNVADVCACLRGQECSRPHRLLSGTLYFGNTLGARRLCDAWVNKNHELQARGEWEGGGQKNLWRTLEEIGPTLKIHRLPGRFTYVFDKPFGYPADEPRWIEHSIASRENRGSIRVNQGRRQVVAEWKQAVGL